MTELILFFMVLCVATGYIIGHLAAIKTKRWQSFFLWGITLAALYTYAELVSYFSK